MNIQLSVARTTMYLSLISEPRYVSIKNLWFIREGKTIAADLAAKKKSMSTYIFATLVNITWNITETKCHKDIRIMPQKYLQCEKLNYEVYLLRYLALQYHNSKGNSSLLSLLSQGLDFATLLLSKINSVGSETRLYRSNATVDPWLYLIECWKSPLLPVEKHNSMS